MEDTSVEQSMVIVLCALLAFAVENDEIFNVDQEILETVVKTMISNNQQPELTIMEDDGRFKVGIKLVHVEDE